MLTLVPCSAHPPPLLLEHLLRSHLLLCSPCLRILGMNTHCSPHTAPSSCPASPPGLGQSGTYTGDKDTVNPSTRRAKEAPTLCMLRGLSCVQAARPAQDTAVLPWAGQGALAVCSGSVAYPHGFVPLTPSQHLPRGRKTLDQELHTVAGLHPIFSSKFRKKGQKLRARRYCMSNGTTVSIFSLLQVLVWATSLSLLLHFRCLM